MDQLENSVGTIAEEVNTMVGKLDRWQHNHLEREAGEKLAKPAKQRGPANAEQIAEEAAAAAEEAEEAAGGEASNATDSQESGSLAAEKALEIEAKELEKAKEQVAEAEEVKAAAEKKVAEEVGAAKAEKAAATKAKEEAAAAKVEAVTAKANATKGASKSKLAEDAAEEEEKAIEEALAAKADNATSVPFAAEAEALEGSEDATDAPLNVTDALADAEARDATERHHEHVEAEEVLEEALDLLEHAKGTAVRAAAAGASLDSALLSLKEFDKVMSQAVAVLHKNQAKDTEGQKKEHFHAYGHMKAARELAFHAGKALKANATKVAPAVADLAIAVELVEHALASCARACALEEVETALSNLGENATHDVALKAVQRAHDAIAMEMPEDRQYEIDARALTAIHALEAALTSDSPLPDPEALALQTLGALQAAHALADLGQAAEVLQYAADASTANQHLLYVAADSLEHAAAILPGLDAATKAKLKTAGEELLTGKAGAKVKAILYGVYDDVSDSLKSDAPLPHSHELEAEKLLEGDDEEIAEIAGETPAEAKTKVVEEARALETKELMGEGATAKALPDAAAAVAEKELEVAEAKKEAADAKLAAKQAVVAGEQKRKKEVAAAAKSAAQAAAQAQQEADQEVVEQEEEAVAAAKNEAAAAEARAAEAEAHEKAAETTVAQAAAEVAEKEAAEERKEQAAVEHLAAEEKELRKAAKESARIAAQHVAEKTAEKAQEMVAKKMHDETAAADAAKIVADAAQKAAEGSGWEAAHSASNHAGIGDELAKAVEEALPADEPVEVAAEPVKVKVVPPASGLPWEHAGGPEAAPEPAIVPAPVMEPKAITPTLPTEVIE